MKQQNQMAKLCLGAVIAALYTVLTLALPVLSYGPIQFRLAEGMTVLAWLCPEAIPGLTLGCFLSNLIGSPYALDWIMAPWPRLSPPCGPRGSPNAGWRPSRRCCATWSSSGRRSPGSRLTASARPFRRLAWNGLTVGIGEAAACGLVGTLLLRVLPRIPALRDLMRQERLSEI